MSPSVCQLLPEVKGNLGDNEFKNHSEVEVFVTRRLIKQDTRYQNGLETIISRYESCLNCGEDGVKWCNKRTV